MEAFLEAISQLGTATYWIAMLIAIVVGTLVGFIPGVGATLVSAILLPSVLLLVDDPALGIVFLAMIGSLNNTLSSIPAVLIGLPDSETQVTYLEGHQLARRGEGAYTLGAVYSVSMLGGVIGAVGLLLAIPVIKPFILQFSYTEIATLGLFGIAMVALLSRGGMAKGLAAGGLGLLLGTIGVDPFSGADRFTFGQIQLWEGLPIVTAILGFFALPELIDMTMTREAVASKEDVKTSRKEVFAGFWYGLKRWPMVIRLSLFGAFLGAVPGVGGSVIDWLSYAFGISTTKDKEKHNFGKGSLEGVLFAEAANNSKAGGQALPTLTLGIPGSSSWAIISVALLAYGLSPGPSLVTEHQDITMLMVITLAVGNIVVAGIGLFATNWLARVTRIPYPTVGFMIMGTVFLAAYLDLSQWYVFIILMGMALIGLLMKQFGWPRPPLLLGFILGPIVETNLLSGLSIYGPIGVMTRPLAIGLFIFMIVSVVALLRMTKETPQVEIPAIDGEPHETASAGTASVPAAGTVGVEVADPVTPRRRLFRTELIPSLFFVLVGGGASLVALGFSETAKILPLGAGMVMFGLGLFELIKSLRGSVNEGQILDLGMRSSELGVTRRTVATMAALLAMFFLLAGIIGLQFSAILFAFIGPLFFMEGRQRITSSLVSGLFVVGFSEFMFRVLGVIWPDPYILSWLGLV